MRKVKQHRTAAVIALVFSALAIWAYGLVELPGPIGFAASIGTVAAVMVAAVAFFVVLEP